MKKTLKERSKMEFDYTTEQTDGILVFHLKGRLMDDGQATDLMNQLSMEVENDHNRIVFDLNELEYMNSTGLNNLVGILTKTRSKGGDALITNVSDKVNELFIVTKLNTVFTVKDSIEEAISQLKSLQTN